LRLFFPPRPRRPRRAAPRTVEDMAAKKSVEPRFSALPENWGGSEAIPVNGRCRKLQHRPDFGAVSPGFWGGFSSPGLRARKSAPEHGGRGDESGRRRFTARGEGVFYKRGFTEKSWRADCLNRSRAMLRAVARHAGGHAFDAAARWKERTVCRHLSASRLLVLVRFHAGDPACAWLDTHEGRRLCFVSLDGARPLPPAGFISCMGRS